MIAIEKSLASSKMASLLFILFIAASLSIPSTLSFWSMKFIVLICFGLILSACVGAKLRARFGSSPVVYAVCALVVVAVAVFAKYIGN